MRKRGSPRSSLRRQRGRAGSNGRRVLAGGQRPPPPRPAPRCGGKGAGPVPSAGGGRAGTAAGLVWRAQILTHCGAVTPDSPALPEVPGDELRFNNCCDFDREFFGAPPRVRVCEILQHLTLWEQKFPSSEKAAGKEKPNKSMC